MSVESYLKFLGNAPEISASHRFFNRNSGEMNPRIFECFLQILTRYSLPKVIWEPFAGTSAHGSSPICILQDIAERKGITLISYGLEPTDKRICVADSTQIGPKCAIGGILFHPPYFGTSPMSRCIGDLSYIRDKDEYVRELGKVIDNAVPFLVPEGLVCVVGRDYRFNGEVCQLNKLFLRLFEEKGFVLKTVWKSIPDVIMIMSKCSDSVRR